MPAIKLPRNRDAPEYGTDADSIDNLVLQNRAYHALYGLLFSPSITDSEDMTIAAAMRLTDARLLAVPNFGRKASPASEPRSIATLGVRSSRSHAASLRKPLGQSSGASPSTKPPMPAANRQRSPRCAKPWAELSPSRPGGKEAQATLS